MASTRFRATHLEGGHAGKLPSPTSRAGEAWDRAAGGQVDASAAPRTNKVSKEEWWSAVSSGMTVLPGGSLLRAMQTHLARVEAAYPDWDSKLLKFNLRYARTFQMKCESQPRRHAELLALPDYRRAARQVQQLQQEYHLWLSRSAGCRKSEAFEQTAQHYLTLRRDQRHATLYIEHFAARSPVLISALIQPPFQAHEVEFPGLGLPDRWAYLTGAGKTRDELQKEIQSAVVRLIGY